MSNTVQLNLPLATKEQLEQTWAFATFKKEGVKRIKRRNLKDLRNCVITACSKQAKLLGIEAGMRYEEAKQLVPEIKILVIGGRNV